MTNLKERIESALGRINVGSIHYTNEEIAKKIAADLATDLAGVGICDGCKEALNEPHLCPDCRETQSRAVW